MTGQTPNPELDEALLELQQYLSDSLAPLIVADSVQLLMKYPPEVVANAIRQWTGAQYRRGSAAPVPISDYLYHTLKKIHMMGEFNLVPLEPLEIYLSGLRPLILALCPQEDRAMLLENLGRLGDAPAAISQAQTIFRQAATPESGPRASAAAASAGAGGSASAPAGTEDAVRGIQRFSLLLERLEAQGGFAAVAQGATSGAGGAAGGSTVPGAGAAPAGASEALAFAARSSQSAQELEGYLARLKGMGLEAGTDNLFRALAQSLPGWVMPSAQPVAGAAPVPETGAIGAMRRIITEGDDPVETGKRFQEMVKTGIESFNEGSLPQAVSMLELAERLTTEKKVDSGSVEVARRRLGDTLDVEQLKKFAEKPDQHGLLRKVLQFFTALRPEALLDELPGEQKRDRRRLVLALLEVHGSAARTAVFEQLSRTPSTAVDEQEWFFRRNLVYLLRRIPRTPETSFEDESDVVLRHAQLGLPLLLVKEAVATLAQYKDERTEQGLTQLLFELEAMLAGKPEEAPYDAKDLRALLDRVAATLGKLPAPRARRALIEHASRRQPQLGDTMARIAELGGQDMSEDTESVDELLALLKANLPFRLLGVTLRQNDQSLVRIVDALAGTPTPSVRRALEEVVAKLAGQDAAKAATKVLAAFDRPKPPAAAEAASPELPAASLQGDLAVFGLPALLQSLGDSSASGTLTLRGLKGGEGFATIGLREGKLTDIQRAHLTGEDALYQLFERPLPGQFAFVKGAVVEGSDAKPREILPLVLEAMRRYDELQEAAALVPDSVFLEPSDVRATPYPGEKDGSFLQALWERASQGATPLDCEAVIASDSYRIRRALAYWVEKGALKIRK